MTRSVHWGPHPRRRTRRPAARARRWSQCLGALVAGVVALLAGGPEAKADTCRERNFVDSLRLFLDGTARATSSDGKTYDGIEGGSFKATFQIELCHPGALDGVIVHLGECTGHYRGCDAKPIMYHVMPAARDFYETRTFEYAVPTDSDAGKSILQTCNARAQDQRGAAGDLEIYPGFFAVTLGVDTRRQLDVLLGPQPGIGWLNTPLQEYSKTAPSTLNLRILCAPLPTPNITGAQLGVATFGDTCPKPAAATVMINAEYPRPVSYKIERGNGTTTTADWIQDRIELQKAPDGRQRPFLSAQHKLPALDAGTRKFRLWISDWGKTPWREVEVDCPPFKVISAWLKYDVEDKDTCPKRVAETATFKATAPGQAPFEIKTQANLVVHSGMAKFEHDGKGYVAKVVRPNLMMSAFDSDMMALIKNQPDANSGWVRLKVDCLEVLSGTLDLREFAATRCEGEAAPSIRTSMPGNVPYQLDCTGGRSWSGTVEAQKTGPDTYLGVDTKRFDVNNNEQVNCALKTRAPLPVKVLTLRGHKYECHRPTRVPGSADFVPETRPDPAPGPRVPDRIADPPRACPPNTAGRWPYCRKLVVVDPPRACPAGTVGRWPNCRKQACPKGTVGQRPNCRPIVRDCPRGTVGKWPNCSKRPKSGCPPGQARVRGRCIKPAG